MKRIIFLLVLLTSFFVFACGGGSSGGLQAPTYNMSGTWTVTDTPQTDTCQAVLDQPSSFTATITHAQGSNSMTMTDTSTSDSYDLTVSGTSITYSGTESNVGSCSSLSQSWEFTAYSESAISGTVSWTCQYPGGSCIGTSSVDAIKAAPTISGFNPTSGPVGTTVTITGANFSATAANNTVKFNGTTALVSNSTTTSITTSVPNGATTGTISVMVSGQTATSAATFTVTGGGGNSAAFTIGGTVSNLSGTVVLLNNGGDEKSISASGTFTFATALVTNATYSVTVKTQPTNQKCTVTNGSGTVSNANVTNVTVSCADKEPNDSSSQAQTITLPASVKGVADSMSDEDWFKFTIASDATVTVKVVAAGDVDLELWTGSAEIPSSTTPNSTETITTSLTMGTYYIRVESFNFSGATNYTLTVTKP